MSEEIEAVDEDTKVTEEADPDDQIDNYRCKHYRRKCHSFIFIRLTVVSLTTS